MSFSHYRLADLPVEPWRNGGGMTRTLATGEAPDNGSPSWRVSVANIDTDGPFSSFEGYDRTIISIDGPPARLHVDGTSTSLVANIPLYFPGESRVYCSIAGPTVDLNVMVRRDLAKAKVWVDRSSSMSLPPSATVDQLVFVLEGELAVSDGVSPGYEAATRFDCLQPERGTGCHLVGNALVVRIEIETLS